MIMLTMSDLFTQFISGVFGSYTVFSMFFIFGIAALMVLVNMPPLFILSTTGLLVIVLYAVIGGVVLQILAAIIALVLGIMLGTAIYSLFRHGI